jgi:glycosyltransferase involved in cell wall biosynthesis
VNELNSQKTFNPEARLVFYAAQLPPEHSTAAAVRCEFFLREIKKHGLPLVVWTHGRAGFKSSSLKTSLASNKSGFVKRLFCELLVAAELTLKICLQRLRPQSKHVVFIFSSPPYIPCLMAAWVCRTLALRYILDIRDLYPEVYFHQGLIREAGLLGQVQKTWARAFYLGAEHIFTVTDGLVEAIRKSLEGGSTHGDAPRMSLVRNGFDADIFQVVEAPVTGFTCVFHGNLGHMQDIQLLKTVAELVYKQDQSIRFLVAGHGPQEDLLKSHVPPNLQFLGELEYQNVPGFLTQAHLGLSFRAPGVIGETAFPVKIYEYIGSGLPVLLTPQGEAGDRLEGLGIGWQFKSSDALAISLRILELAKNKSAYNEVKDRVCAQRPHFSRQKATEIFISQVTESVDLL